MELRLRICREATGAWSLTGLPRQPLVEFTNLAAGLDYARRECDAAPALIELFSDGIYVVASQKQGWPRPLCRPAKAERGDRSTFAELADRVQRCAGHLRLRYLAWLSRNSCRPSA